MYRCCLIRVLFNDAFQNTASAFGDEPRHIAVDIIRAMFAETSDSFQHSTRLIPDSRSCILNPSRESIRIKIILKLKIMENGSCRVRGSDNKCIQNVSLKP